MVFNAPFSRQASQSSLCKIVTIGIGHLLMPQDFSFLSTPLQPPTCLPNILWRVGGLFKVDLGMHNGVGEGGEKKTPKFCNLTDRIECHPDVFKLLHPVYFPLTGFVLVLNWYSFLPRKMIQEKAFCPRWFLLVWESRKHELLKELMGDI